jgi:hypothetical protein
METTLKYTGKWYPVLQGAERIPNNGSSTRHHSLGLKDVADIKYECPGVEFVTKPFDIEYLTKRSPRC